MITNYLIQKQFYWLMQSYCYKSYYIKFITENKVCLISFENDSNNNYKSEIITRGDELYIKLKKLLNMYRMNITFRKFDEMQRILNENVENKTDN